MPLLLPCTAFHSCPVSEWVGLSFDVVWWCGEPPYRWRGVAVKVQTTPKSSGSPLLVHRGVIPGGAHGLGFFHGASLSHGKREHSQTQWEVKLHWLHSFYLEKSFPFQAAGCSGVKGEPGLIPALKLGRPFPVEISSLGLSSLCRSFSSQVSVALKHGALRNNQV